MLPSYLSFLLDQQHKFDYADAFFFMAPEKREVINSQVKIAPHPRKKKSSSLGKILYEEFQGKYSPLIDVDITSEIQPIHST